MGKDKSNNGILSGILGGLTVSLFNTLTQERSENQIDWDDIDYFEPFSYAESRKRDGYKLKYDIDESKVKPKLINLIQDDEYLYILKIANHPIKGSIKSVDGRFYGPGMEYSINNMVKDTLDEAIVILEDTLPSYWVYGKKESDQFVKIIITDEILEGDFCDDYPCLDLTEASELAEEMKKYYHNYVERVLISEKIEEGLRFNETYYEDMILDTIPNYFDVLDRISNLDILKYDEISEFLYEVEYDEPINLLYTFYSLGIQLYKDQYFNCAKEILESILDLDKDLLDGTGLKNDIYYNLIEVGIKLEDEKEIVRLLESRTEGNRDIFYLARRLYDLKFYEAANKAYRIFIEIPYLFAYDDNLFEAYLRTEGDEGLRNWRQKLIEEGKSTFFIDRHLSDNDPKGLSIKISTFEKDEDWEEVINHCNKYIKLIVSSKWGKIDDMLEFELKKINAYIQLNKLNEAWIGSCKARRTLISNFNGFGYFEYLSEVENYMAYISLEQDYFIDTIYHSILKTIYNDIFDLYYNPDEGLPRWHTDLFLEDIIKECDLNQWWIKMETLIINEYKLLSGKSPRRISRLILDSLEEDNYKIKLNKPKKYFPTIIATDFNM